MTPKRVPPSGLDAPAAATRIRRRTRSRPTLALVLGSGFNGALAAVTIEAVLPYQNLPGFHAPTVSGHAGRVVFGRLADTPVVVLCGRAHYYEGCSLAEVTFPMRVLQALGVQAVLLTNAAGGIRRGFLPGDFMILSDHINLMGANPLRGADAGGLNRFVDLSRAYDQGLGKLLQRAARTAKANVHTGVYLAVSGPSYETPAEIRAFARLGADAVGMSTVPETIVARQCGLRVAGLSCITNLAAGRGSTALSHREVIAVGHRVEAQAARLLEEFARLYAQETFST